MRRTCLVVVSTVISGVLTMAAPTASTAAASAVRTTPSPSVDRGEPARSPRSAPTCTPGTPAVVGSAGDRLTVTVPPCASGAGVTGYRVFALGGSAESAAGQADVALGQSQVEVTNLTAGTRYRFRVAARNAEGVGPLGARSADASPPFVALGTMVDRQYLDFGAAAPTSTEKATWLADLASGARTPIDLVGAAEQLPYWQKQSPVIRLFQAYFLRLPDKSGLAYWTGKFRKGTKLSSISQSFASSSEFVRRYGTLSNRKFVEQIYLNVLGRAGEESGIAYWTAKLDKKTKNRGEVMVGFSESSEYVRKTTELVWTVNLFTGMLLRLPTAAEVATWKAQTKPALIVSLLGSAAYVARVGVVAPPTITTASLPAGKVGVAYPSTPLAATGGTGTRTWSISGGSLPAGLTMSAAGVITGTPEGSGTSFTVRVQDAAARASTRQLSIAIPVLAITTTTLPDGTVGSAYPDTQLTAANAFGSVSWQLEAGDLPAGVFLGSDGVLAGTPTKGGASTFTIGATDDAGTHATKAFTITVPALAITTASLPSGVISQPYPETQLVAANTYGSVTWTIKTGSLPAGLVLSAEGIVSGTPTASGTANLTVQAADEGGSLATKAFSVAISSFAITTGAVPGGYVGLPYNVALRSVGGTGPSWSITSGALPAGLTLAASTGVISGTPTTAGSSTFTAKVDAAGGKTASRQYTIAVTAPADWPQAAHDEGSRAWNPGDGGIDAGNVAGISQEWAIPGSLQPTIVGNLIYAAGEVPGRSGTYAPLALDLATGDLAWFGPSLPEGCSGGPVAVTATAVIVQCGTLLAYQRTGSHSLLWNTATTDPGVSTQSMVVSGSTVVTWTSDRVLGYRLSDGQRLWQQLLPSGATSLSDVAVSGTTVVVAYDDRLRALSLTTGAQQWTRSMPSPGDVVIADSWAYVRVDGGVSRFALATGAPGWAVLSGTGIYQLVGIDADTVYAFEARFSEAGQESAVLRALAVSTGGQRWEAALGTRIRSAGITKDLVWIHESQIYAWGRNSNLIAFKRTDGTEAKRIHFDDNSYGDDAFGNGHVVISQGGSFGGPDPARLRSYGFTPPTPTITSKLVPTGRVGTAYSAVLTVDGGSGATTWSIASGTLPAGLTLSGAGVMTGTPTAATATRVQVRVTDALGRSRTRTLYVQIVGTGTNGWAAEGHGATRDGYNSAETAVSRDVAAQLAFRWKTATPVGTEQSLAADRQPTVAGTRVFDVDMIGRLAAYSTTGTTANRAPAWTLTALDGNYYPDAPVESSGTLYLFDSARNLDAVRASDGARLWHVPGGPAQYLRNEVLVVGTKVLFLDSDYDLTARNTSDGSVAWGGSVVALDGNELLGSVAVASDGTRAFVLANCVVHAITVSTGVEAWAVPVKAGGSASCGVGGRGMPMVADGAVFASTYDGSIAIEAATGAVRWRTGTRGGYGNSGGAIADGVWVLAVGGSGDGDLAALDLATGEVLWQTKGGPSYLQFAVAGDLLVAANGNTLVGFDLLTGEQIWDGGAPDTSGYTSGGPSIAAGKVFVSTRDGVKAYGIP